ncbi:hypothetical protein PPL_12229 [Heterostelium album PN500]|uniref:Uncharacterized protein n=1 Tax=Heterostelium pallidum (strain ATCC 26659 / Pp 5 / PN500) TaxID=670386 RepID=D3BM21_HETP5|nr:hypothetical protein PPL_12229 [Heterostelium album PN500]EFA77622.1 hypothetical protein PPL_12229 [Heterostelium album PN500]|eukprot:XP_020429750.1 hypothetical protein PPL_12229 [Heterostelium album PN500]
MFVEKVGYLGWKNCYRIQYQNLQCIVTTDVGPRIISLRKVNNQHLSQELMGVAQADAGQVGGTEWKLYGGHRLWSAPEQSPRTYFPDNFSVAIEIAADRRSVNRLKLGNRYIVVEQQPTATTTNKIGARVNNGWTCAVNSDTLFVKLIDRETKDLNVDLGANVECYLSPDILELETVGPLTLLEPKQSVTLTEKWFLFDNSVIPTNDQTVDASILPTINRLL